jgi:hypothetical protein
MIGQSNNLLSFLETVFEEVLHILYYWHININAILNTKKHFLSQRAAAMESFKMTLNLMSLFATSTS